MKLSFRRIDLHLTHTWTLARTAGADVAPVVIVELLGEDGAVGIGEAAPTERYAESAETVERFLRKIDPARLSFDDVEGSLRYLDTLSPGDASAKCAVDIALLDGAARRAGKPLYDHLGLGFREGAHVTSFTIGIDTPEVIRKKVLAAAAYPVLKMKVGVPADRDNLAALREVAPNKTIRVDANEGWRTREEALERLEWLAADGHIQYVEQPLPADAPRSDWEWLRARTPLPIFADESYHTAADLERVRDCVHGVNVKLIKSGGVSRGYAALKAARGAGLQTMIGCMIESSVLISAGAHLAELCDFLDLDGNLLINDDPFAGVTAASGVLSFAAAKAKTGLRVSPVTR